MNWTVSSVVHVSLVAAAAAGIGSGISPYKGDSGRVVRPALLSHQWGAAAAVDRLGCRWPFYYFIPEGI